MRLATAGPPRHAMWTLALSAFFLLAASSCGDGEEGNVTPESGSTERPAVPEAERYGGTAVVAGRNDLVSMNGFVTSDDVSIQHQVHLLFATLVRTGADLEPQPYLAESWEFSDDSLAVTVDLRDDLAWHDGEPVTSADVAFTLASVRDPAVNYPNAAYFDAWEGVELLGEHRLRFTVRRVPHPFFGWGRMPILPAHVLADVPPAELANHGFGTSPVGSGPFRFVEHVPGERWVFEANPDFPAALGGRPYLDRYVYRPIAEDVTLTASLLSGDVDVVIEPARADAARLAADTAIRVIESPGRAYDFIAWNSRRPMFSDADVRRALTMAIDRQALVRTVLGGRGRVAAGPVGPSHWAHDTTHRPLPYAPDSSRAILDRAGWVDSDGDGVRDRDGVPFRFTLLSTPQDKWNDVGASVQRDLSAVGIEVDPQTREGAALQPLVLSPDRRFDAVMIGFIQDPNLDERAQWACDLVATPMQFTSYCNRALDAVMDSLQTPLDRATQKRLIDRYHEILSAEQPYTWLYYEDDAVATRSYVRGVSIDGRGEWVTVADWWLEPPARGGAD